MRPIDKFEYTLQELETLEYAIYMNAVNSSGNQYGWLPQIGIDEISNNPNKIVCPFPPAIEIFSNRYNERKVTNYFKYEDYLVATEIQEYLAYFELDKDKFWFLLLFTYDFCESVCTNGITVADSPYDQLQKLINTILPHVNYFNQQYGSTFDTKIELNIHVKGIKGTIKIDSPTALHFIADSCKKRIEEEKIEESAWIQYREIQEEAKGLKDSRIIYFFANMFLKWFNSQERIYSKRKKAQSIPLKKENHRG